MAARYLANARVAPGVRAVYGASPREAQGVSAVYLARAVIPVGRVLPPGTEIHRPGLPVVVLPEGGTLRPDGEGTEICQPMDAGCIPLPPGTEIVLPGGVVVVPPNNDRDPPRHLVAARYAGKPRVDGVSAVYAAVPRGGYVSARYQANPRPVHGVSAAYGASPRVAAGVSAEYHANAREPYGVAAAYGARVRALEQVSASYWANVRVPLGVSATYGARPIRITEDIDPDPVRPYEFVRPESVKVALVVDWLGAAGNQQDLRPGPENLRDVGGGLRNDVTQWCHTLAWELGRDPGDLLSGIDDGGRLTAELYNAPEPMRTAVLEGRRVQLWAQGPGGWIPLWGGRGVEELTGRRGGAPERTRLRAEGPTGSIRRRQWDTHVPVERYGRFPTPGLALNLLLDLRQAGREIWPRAERRIENGVQRLNSGALASVAGGPFNLRAPLDAMREIARADGGYVYGDELARLVFEGRRSRSLRYQARLRGGQVPALRAALAQVTDREELSYAEGIYNIFSSGGGDSVEVRSNAFALYEGAGGDYAVTGMPGGATGIIRIPGEDLKLDVPGSRYIGVDTVSVEVRGDDGFRLQNFNYRVEFAQTYPDLWVRVVLLNPQAPGSYSAHVLRVTGFVAFREVGFIDAYRDNPESAQTFGPRPYLYGSKLYPPDRATAARTQRYYDWAAANYGRRWDKWRVEMELGAGAGSPEWLGYGLGEFVHLDQIDRGVIIERVSGEYSGERSTLKLTWGVVDAAPYREVP